MYLNVSARSIARSSVYLMWHIQSFCHNINVQFDFQSCTHNMDA